MNKCPICKAPSLPPEKQPQPSLHVFSTLFECGCRVDQAFSSDEWLFGQRCDKPWRKDVVKLALENRKERYE